MTDEEAKKEHDEIQAEIAKARGEKPEPKEDPKEEEEIVETEEEEKEPEPKEDVEPEDDSTDPAEKKDDEDKDVDPEDKKSSRYIPLSKYQELKRTDREALATKDAEIQRLTGELDKSKNAKGINDKIKSYSEKHGMTEEMVLDLVQLVKGENALDPETREVIEKSKVQLKKQEAQQAFESEFTDLIKDAPDAKNARDLLQKKAYEKGNLEKSLYEIYHRQVLPTMTSKKKTAEPGRSTTGREISKGDLDFKKIAEDIRNNVPNVLGKLSPDQQDKFFDWAQNNGSRYNYK